MLRRLRELSGMLALNAGRMLLALLLTAALLFMGVGSLYATSAPKWVSLLVEPLSLLLLPGIVIGMVTGSKDVAPDVTISVCVAFYFGAVYAGLVWLDRRSGWRESGWGRGRGGSR